MKKLFNYLIILWVVLIGIGLIIVTVPESPHRPLIPSDGWTIISGIFFANGKPGNETLPLAVIHSSSSKFWRSWSPEQLCQNGSIRSVPFYMQGSTLELPIVGYPEAPGNKIYLENITTKEKFFFRYGNAHETWQSYLIEVPPSWRNIPLCVGADAYSNVRYVGIGTPFEVGKLALYKKSFPVCLFWHAFICALLLVITAPLNRLFQCFFDKKFNKSRLLFFPLAIGVTGYILFFIYYLSLFFAGLFVFLLLICGCIFEQQNIKEVCSCPQRFFLRRPILLFWIFITAFSWLVLNSQNTISLDYIANYRFSPASWSTDNQLPIVVAKALSQGVPLHGLFGGWQVSDRPPALAGLLAPLSHLTSWWFANKDTNPQGGWLANLAGLCVMGAWVFPIWECLRRSGVHGKKRMYAMSLLSISPFIFFNTVYIWPKLISATLAFTGWILLNRVQNDRAIKKEAIGAGISFGTALMCHGSIFFGLSALGVLCVTRLLKTQWKNLLIAAIVAFLTITPWLIFVKKVDPPGNALMKCTFAGTFGFEEKDKSLLKTVAEAYKKDSLKNWKERKFLLVKGLIGPFNMPIESAGYPNEGLIVRSLQFFYLVPVLGLFLIPLFFGVYFFPSNKEKNNFSAATFLKLGLIGILIQGLVTWGSLPVHHLAYSSVLCLHLASVIYLCKFSQAIRNNFLFFTVLLFGVIWIISPALEFGSVNVMTFIASLGLLIVMYFLNRSSLALKKH